MAPIAALGALALPSLAADHQGAVPAAAVPEKVTAARTITVSETAAVVEQILFRLANRYVQPEVAQRVNCAIRKHLDEGAYAGVASGEELAYTLTQQLQDITHEKHLYVIYGATALPPMTAATWGEVPAEERARRDEWMRKRNFGFRRAEVLDGNVGYLDIVGFAPCHSGWETVVATMRFIADTDALIIDLRDNRGGSPEMVTVICSYLFADGFKSIHINDITTREDGEAHQFWALPFVPGKHYSGKDVYVLTSSSTFSSGEELAHDLQALRRATVVGETTAGGAHVGGMERLNDHFAVFVPSGESVNPVTGKNWEGVGVITAAERVLESKKRASWR